MRTPARQMPRRVRMNDLQALAGGGRRGNGFGLVQNG
jgi:hypothetical protein